MRSALRSQRFSHARCPREDNRSMLRIALAMVVAGTLAVPATAGATTYCVNSSPGCPGTGVNPANAETIGMAGADRSDGDPDRVIFPAGTYNNSNTWTSSGSDALEILGAGPQTVLSSAASGDLQCSTRGPAPARSTVHDLTVLVPSPVLRRRVRDPSGRRRLRARRRRHHRASIAATQFAGMTFRDGMVTSGDEPFEQGIQADPGRRPHHDRPIEHRDGRQGRRDTARGGAGGDPSLADRDAPRRCGQYRRGQRRVDGHREHRAAVGRRPAGEGARRHEPAMRAHRGSRDDDRHERRRGLRRPPCAPRHRRGRADARVSVTNSILRGFAQADSRQGGDREATGTRH